MFNDLRTGLLESTEEQPRPQMTKQIDPHKRKPAQKYFHPVRWSKAFLIGYQQRGITLITFEMNEPGNMTVGAVHKKIEQLDKEFSAWNALFTFSPRTKLSFEARHDWILGKQGQSGRPVIRSSVDAMAWIPCLFLTWNLVSFPIKTLDLSGRVTFRGNSGVTHWNIALYSKGWELFCRQSLNLGNTSLLSRQHRLSIAAAGIADAPWYRMWFPVIQAL